MRSNRRTFLSTLLGLTLLLAVPAISQESREPTNQEVQQARRSLIERYWATQDLAERARIVTELTRLRAQKEEGASWGARGPVGPQHAGNASSGSRNRRPEIRRGSLSNLPHPSSRAPQSTPSSDSDRPRSVGLGTGVSDPSRFGLRAGGSSTSLAEKKHFFRADEEGKNLVERGGSRVLSRDGIETPEVDPPESDAGKSSVRRLAEKTEVSATFLKEGSSGSLKKFESESAEAFEKRKSLAKGRAGVRFGAGNASVTGDAKFNPGKGEVGAGVTAEAGVAAVKASSEGRLGNDALAVKGSASGSVAKANASLDARIGVTKEFVGAKAEAGAGASLAEGSVSGSLGSRWLGIEVGGELTGSVITAEARGSASAGFNRKSRRFEVEVGGKIGALLVGGGAKAKVSLNKPGWWPW